MEVIEINCYYAYLWPWILIILAAGGTGGLVAIIIDSLYPPEQNTNITVLGTQGAGKTTLWRAITGSNESVKPTIGIEEIEEATITINDITRRIRGGQDISGGEDNVRSEYKRLIEKNEFIIFIFNVKDFFESKDMNEDVLMRISVVLKYLDDRKSLHIIGSHADELTKSLRKRMKMREDVVKRIQRELPKSINLNNNLTLLNLTNKEEIDTYINEVLFKKEE